LLEERVMKKAFLLVVCFTLVFVACATVEYTDRKRLLLINEQEEEELGKEAFQQVLMESTLSTNEEQVDALNSVGVRIAAVADRPEYEWEFVLIDDPDTVNAFALPGGKVAFYSGIMPVCRTKSGIAVVMGHEVGHVVARHGAERMSQGLVTGLAGAALQAAITGKSPEAQAAIMNGYGIAATTGVLLPFSRKHESEADYIGLILMAKAGYNPQEAVAFWERMSEMSGGSAPPEFLSTHPSNVKRIEDLRAALPEAMQYYRASRNR
jgi:predicted Zn-dependent protease